MTLDEFKTLHPQDAVFVQVDDVERTMTDDEYAAWVAACVDKINNPLP